MTRCVGLAAFCGMLTPLLLGACQDLAAFALSQETLSEGVCRDRFTYGAVDRTDVLLVIDDSPSMRDKQELLMAALPQLVHRWIQPGCVDPTSRKLITTSNLDGCPTGSVPELSRAENLHIGVIRASLSRQGTAGCITGLEGSDGATVPGARLLTWQGDGSRVDTHNDRGFLVRDPRGLSHDPPSGAYPGEVIANVAALVSGVGSDGCECAAPLEAWYRFLVDPEPAEQYAVTGGVALPHGLDEVVLEQRAQFLRPDSQLVIIMVTDGDDCSSGNGQLYPIDRYVQGLTSREVPRRDGSLAPNPLFAASAAHPEALPRLDHSLIRLVGIVGVPWETIATDDSLTDPAKLEYLKPVQLAASDTWEELLRDATASPVPGPTAPYSCTFPLATPVDCARAEPGVCACQGADAASSPLCDGSTQLHAGAEPTPRILQVLRDYGTNSVLASICPKQAQLGALTDPSFGFNSAMATIVRPRDESSPHALCLGCAVTPDPGSGEPNCQLLEVTRSSFAPDCDTEGRAEPNALARRALRREMQRLGMCGDERTDCDEFRVCEITRARGAALEACREDPTANQAGAGYCYLSAMAEQDLDGDGERICEIWNREVPTAPPRRGDCVGNPELLDHCARTEMRGLAIVDTQDNPVPWPQATTFITCETEQHGGGE